MVRIASIIPTDQIHKYEIEDDYEYYKETAPAGMDEMRRPTGYQEFLYEKHGKPIMCNPKEYYRLESGEMSYSYKLLSHETNYLSITLEMLLQYAEKELSYLSKF